MLLYPRRPVAVISPTMIQYMHLRAPWVTAWWSAAFPGLGHIFLGSHIKGFMLFIWELIVNTQAHLNSAIIYTFTGQFELARQVVDYRWLLLYAPVYIASIWTSYRLTIETNKYRLLALRQLPPLPASSISSLEINFLDKRPPWVAVAWSFLTPGIGHLYLHRPTTGFFLLLWWIAIAYESGVALAVHYSLIGDFAAVKQVVQADWLIFMPSIHGFAIYDAYVSAIEGNRLYKLEQDQFLYKTYHSPDFKMPV